jgi:hypothetical protein
MAKEFWNQQIEPNRKNRWRLTLNSNTIGLLQYALKKCSAPSYKINSITHKFSNHNFYYPGRLEWNTIPITFASVTQQDATQLIHDVLGAGGYKTPSAIFTGGTINYGFLNKKNYNDAIGPKGVALEQLDSGGAPINTWTINKPFFTDIKFGTLDYNSEEIVDIECTMRFDWAELADPQAQAQSAGS